MVAAIVDIDGELIGLHRTYLNGAAKADVDPIKAMLGRAAGGAVRLAAASRVLAVAEGIETALAVMAGCGWPTWAALSAGGIEALILPALPLAADVLIGADNDRSGRGLRAAEIAATRWLAEGRRVRISLPPEVGTDWADIQQFQKCGARRER